MASILNAGRCGVLALTLFGVAPLKAQKTDVVVLKNGDQITGEVKAVSRGKLDYSTDDLGHLSIEWDKVLRLSSRNTFEIELRSGQILFGSLVEGAPDGSLAISGAAINAISIADVVRLTPIERRLWHRLSGNLDVGLTYAKANENLQLTSAGELRYRESRFEGTFRFSTYLQDQSGSNAATENNIGVGAQRVVGRHWSAGLVGQFQQNDELNLAHRLTLGAVAVRTLVESPHAEVQFPVGMVVNQERFYGADTSNTSLEGLVGIEVVTFRFDSPKLEFSSLANGYPSLTQWGRFRFQADVRARYELLKDFFLGLRFTDSYDSDPPDPGSSKNDLTTAFTVGWSFNE